MAKYAGGEVRSSELGCSCGTITPIRRILRNVNEAEHEVEIFWCPECGRVKKIDNQTSYPGEVREIFTPKREVRSGE